MTLFLLGLGLLLAAGVSAIASPPTSTARSLYQGLSIAGCIAAAIDAVRVLARDAPVTVSLSSTLPGGDWRLALDPLAAVFVLAVLVVGGACAIFGTHVRETDEAGDARPAGVTQLGFMVLLVAIALVVTAASVVAFLGAWEVMAISSYVLIVTNHEKADVRRAGLIYLVATHTATLSLFAMFAAWATAGSAADWTFESLGRRFATSGSRNGRRHPPAGALRVRIQGRLRAAALLAPAGARRRAEPRLGADVRRRHQDRDLRTAPRPDVARGRARMVGLAGLRDRRGIGRARRALGAGAARHPSGCWRTTASRTSGSSSWEWVSAFSGSRTTRRRWRCSVSRAVCCTRSITRSSRACSSLAPAWCIA